MYIYISHIRLAESGFVFQVQSYICYTAHHQKGFIKQCKHTPPNNAHFTSQERSSTPAGFLGIVINEQC